MRGPIACQELDNWAILGWIKNISVNMMSQETFAELTKLATGSEIWDYAKDFDGLVESTKVKANVGGDFEQITKLWAEFACSHFFVQLALEKKTQEVARGILDALSAPNLVVQLNLSRALVEHVACIAHQLECLKRAVEEIKKTQSTDKAWTVTDRHLKILDRLYYGGNLGKAKQKKVHVNDMIKSATVHWKDASLVYDRLCEFVHPNYGSNLLVSSGELGRGQVGIMSHLAEEETSFLCSSAEVAASHCSELQVRIVRYLIEINQWIELIANTKPSSLAQVFTVRTSNAGDGSSKETAISFKQARNHREAVQAFYAWAENQKIEIYKRKLVAVEDGWLFDVAATNKGSIWVKYKMDSA